MTTREMREKRGQIAHEMAELTKKNPLSTEDRAKFDAMDAEQEQLRKDVEAIERAEALEAELRINPPRREPAGDDPDPEKEAEKREKRYSEAYWRFMKQGLNPDQYGFKGVAGEDRTVLAERRTTLSGVQTEGVSGGAYPGSTTGFFVPVGFVNRVEEALKWYGGMLGGGRGDPEIMETATGQPLPFPTDNDTTISGELVGEGVQVATQGVTWSQIVMGAFKFSTKLVPVSFELLQDSAFDLETYLSKKFGIRLGRILNNKLTVGVGTTEPNGIVTASTSSGQTVIGDDNATTPDKTQQVGYLDLVNLEHSTDVAYRQGSKWMFHDLTLASIKKLKDKYGRPLWIPGLTANAPDNVLGYPYIVNNDMANVNTTSPVSARVSVLFGPMDKYLIRKVKELQVLRLVERFADYGVVAFIGFARYDGNLLDAGTHPIKSLTNPAS